MMIPATKGEKGNTGESANRRRNRRLKVLCCIVGSYVVFWICNIIYEARFAGMFVTDISVDPLSGHISIRRRPNRFRPPLYLEKVKNSPYQSILEGYLTLVDIRIPPTGLQGGSKYDVQGVFCALDWKLHIKNPSNFPMFKDLKRKSSMCESTETTFDLWPVIQQAKEYDAKFINNVTKTVNIHQDGAIRAVEPTGVIFHETRCGSTLVANLLASFAPTQTKVYSESPPPVSALRACEMRSCDTSLHNQLIRDVIYIMGRSNRKQHPQYLFFKIQSIGTMQIRKFAEVFPDTPWVFVYRDTVEIMQSHWKGEDTSDGGKHLPNSRTPVCARNYNLHVQPPTTSQILKSNNIKDAKSLTKVEYCAAHLGGLSLSALQEHERTGKGRFVNYKQLPDIIWEDILPNEFDISSETINVDNMKDVSNYYSKGRGKKANTEWEEDSIKKQNMASKYVINVSNKFVGTIYNQMEALSKKNIV